MEQFFVMYITILLSVGCVSYVIYSLVIKYLAYKKELTNGMMLLVEKSIEKLDKAFDKLNPPIPDVNVRVQNDLDKLREELNDIISKASMNNVAKAFAPRRKG